MMTTTRDTPDQRRESSSAPTAMATRAGLAGPDFRQVFESISGRFLVLDPNLRIVAATEAYARAVVGRREMLIGKTIFDLFAESADNSNSHSPGVGSLRASLRRVLQERVSDTTAIQEYDVRRPAEKGGGFEERHWSTLNSPVLAPDGSVAWIIHGVEDVTELVRAAADERKIEQLNGSLPQSYRLAVQLMGEAGAARRKEAEEALHKAEKRLRLVLAATEIGTFEIDFASGTAHWNAIEFGLLGLRPGDAPAGPETFFRYVHPADREALRLKWDEATRNGELNAEFRIVRPDGRERWLAGRGRFVSDEAEDGATAAAGATRNPARFLGVNFDITERKEAEQALAESQQRFAGIVGSAMDAIVSVDADQKIVLFNAAAEKMFGCAASIAIGGPLERFIPERFRAAHAEHVRQLAKTGLASRSMGRMGSLVGLRASGVEFPIEASISKIEVGGHSLSTVILRDISERRRLEQEVLEISAREQRRIGRELHDDVCQWLAGSELLTSALARSLATESPRLARRAEKIVESIRQALARSRVLAHGLEPSVIQSEGLVGALRELAMNAAEMFRVRCEYVGPATVDVRDEVAALHLYRIAQEAIANAVRHGGAGEIQVVLQTEPESISMLIRDDGSGIALPLQPTDGIGLRNMRYRAGIIGATLDVRRGSTRGTEIVCTFPRAL